MKDFLQAIVYAGAFLVLFIPIIVSDSMYFPFITGKNFYFRILVEIIFASWAILALLDTRFRPKFSWVLASLVTLIAVMLVANALGAHPGKSFWSNYERMDGYVTLLHFFMYFVVLAGILHHRTIDFLGFKTTPWQIFFGTAMVAAAWVTFVAFQQLAGNVVITQGGVRITGTLGNAAYMAVYMLFNIFIAVWLIITSKNTWLRAFLAALTVVFIYLLIQTATRGTIVGLAGGMFLGASYIALFNTAYPVARKWALGVLAAVVIAVGGLYVLRDSSFVDNNPIIDRATKIGFSELTLRTQIWGMGLVGVQERPILGWGQDNFNYIFNREYIPEIYYAEQWYDRAHNVFLDWLTAGGVLGLLAYLSVFAAATYYVVILPWLRPDESFTVVERGVLLGILAAYFAHNLVVFDNIVSFIFFAVVLALIHSRVARVIPKVEAYTINPTIVSQMIAPVVIVLTIVIVYLVNIPAMQTAADIIRALRTADATEKMEYFDRALARGTFGNQEVAEQYLQQALAAYNNQALTEAERLAFVQKAEVAMLNMIMEKPNDARLHVFLGGFYRTLGRYDQAREQLDIARGLSPNKPSIVIEQAVTAFQSGDVDGAETLMREAYELEPRNPTAQIILGAVLIFKGDIAAARSVVAPENFLQFASNNFVLNAAQQSNDYELLRDILEVRIAAEPQSAQLRTSLSFVHYQNDNTAEAIAVLEDAVATIPEFATRGTCYIENLKADREPSTGC